MDAQPSRSVHLGAFAMAVYSFVVTGHVVFNKILVEHGWPVWYINSFASCLLFLVCAFIFFGRRMPWPEKWQVKLVFLRAFCVTVSFVFSFIAVLVTGSPGDVNALTSVNVVAASALGHVFLNERLRLVHASAVLCSLVGAACIARPGFLFGNPKGDSAALFLGYVFAMASGFVRATAFVSARKYGQVPIVFVSMWVMAINTCIFAVVPHSPMADEESLKLVADSPWLATGVVAANVAMTAAAMATGILGSMLCPAAVSATIFTASGMVFGYLAQSVIFHSDPDALNLVGALLMFCAVVLMTVFRVRPAEASAAAGQAGQATEEGHLEVDDNFAAQAEEESHESLFEFAASEFAAFEPHSETLRLRRQGTADDRFGGQVIGAVAATAMTAVMPVASQ